MELTNKIKDKSVREGIARDCTHLIDEQVSAKGGLSGIALKATYGVVKGVGGDYVSGAISRLLPEAMAALEPIWNEGEAAGDPVSYLSEHSDRTADILLSTTDARIAKNGGGIVGASYHKLRQSVKPDVVTAVPKLAKIINKHIS